MDTTQIELLIYQYLGYLMLNYRDNLIGLLKQDGYQIDSNSSDEKVRVTIIAAIHTSAAFRDSLQDLMEQAAHLEFANVNAAGPSTINDLFSKDCNGCKKKKNCTGCKKFKNADSGFDYTDYSTSNDLSGTSQDYSSAYDSFNEVDNSSYPTQTYTPASTSSGSTSSGSSSGSLGSALKGLINTNTLQSVLNVGLSYLSTSIQQKSQATNNAAALQLSANQLAAQQLALQSKTAQTTTTSTWIWPVVIIVVVLGVTGISIALIRRK